MANEVAAINNVPIGSIGAINGVQAASIAAVNNTPFVTAVPDSINVYPGALYYWQDGQPEYLYSFDVTASGTWTTTVIDGGYGTDWVYFYPTSGSGNDYVNVYTDYNDTGQTRGLTIRFTRGTAYYDVYVIQYNYM